MPDDLSLHQLLSQGRPADTAVAYRNGEIIAFEAFQRRTAAWRSAFAAERGQRWALYCNDSFEFAATLFGAWHAGKRVYLPADVQALTLTRLSQCVDGFVGDIPAGQRCLPPPSDVSSVALTPLDPDMQGLVVYTSGSSGEPVAIPKRLRQLFTEVSHLSRCWPDLPTDAVVHGTVSHQHIYGLLLRVLWPLATGRSLAAQRLVYPEDMQAQLGQQASILISSPAHLKRLPPQLDWAPVAAKLAAVFSSGGPLPASALPDCRQYLGQAPIEIYGSSETGGIAWRQRHTDTQLAWQPLPGVQLRVDQDCLQVQSTHLADTQWLQTADRVRMLGDSFELLGRADRIVKVEEKRVSLQALEAGLLASGLLEDARVLSLPDSRNSLAVVAVPNAAGWALFDQQGKRGLNQALRTLLLQQAEASVLPRRWRYSWSLPVNTQGKLTLAALQDCFDPRRPESRLLRRDAETAVLRVDVQPDSPYFAGHFASAAILPGVTQIEWVIALGRELFALPASFLGLENIKFQQVILPDTQLELRLDYAADRGCLSFNWQSSAGQHASGKIIFAATP